MTQDEMVGWRHRPDGPEFEQAPGDGEGQGSLACCSPLGRKQLDVTEQLNNRLGVRSGITYGCRRNPRLRFAFPEGFHDPSVHQRRDFEQNLR